MGSGATISRSAVPCALGLVTMVMAGCSGSAPRATGGATEDGPDASTQAAASSSSASTAPADTSRSVVQRVTTIDVSPAVRSIPFAQLPDATGPSLEEEHEPLRPPRPPWSGVVPAARPDQAVQSSVPLVSMPASLTNFPGQGNALGGPCQSGSTCSTPPDTNGAVGPNDFVQLTNVNGTAGVAIWDKTGKLLAGPKHVGTLWTNYPDTDGNGCAMRNDGDPVVLYDQLADRWFITQFSLPNTNKSTGPAFQCVAVSQTADPTGAYYLYDFEYAYAIDDYGKFSVWPDAYYATFNMFGKSYAGDDFCAYDRASMLQGKTATQQCFLQPYPTNTTSCPSANEPFAVFGALPANADGPIPPPSGEPGYFMQFDYSQCGPTYDQLDLWTLHVDFTTPANSKLTGPTVLTVASFTPTCWANDQTGGTGNPNCLPQPGSTVTLDGLDDRLMFRFNYRNFGAYESLLVNHSVVGGSGKGGTTNTGSGIRWYEIRSPASNPTVFQQSTYAPADGNWRWMGSIAQDQAGDMALGFAITSNGGGGSDVAFPSVAWTGRLSTDPASTMGQGEAVIDTGGGDENDAYATPAPDEHRGRWGDYSAMTVDPTDDCTFWYTQELYHQNGIGAWDTYIASMKFPSCAANDFSIGVSPPSQNVGQGGHVTYTVSTSLAQGTAESIGLYAQDLPAGVTASFSPTSVTAGKSSTLTLMAAANAPATGTPAPTFMVIGKAPSAVHAATAQVGVTGCTPITTCPAPDECGALPDGCGGTVTCGTCGPGQTCVGNQCGTVVGAGDAGGSDAGTTVDAGGSHDAGSTTDASGGDDGSAGASDSGVMTGDDGGSTGGGDDAGAEAATGADGGTGSSSGQTSGCGCVTAGGSRDGAPPWTRLGFGVFAIGALRLRRRSRRAGEAS